jgi:hypothetical protein
MLGTENPFKHRHQSYPRRGGVLADPCPGSLRSAIVSPAWYRSAKPQPGPPATGRIAMPGYGPTSHS